MNEIECGFVKYIRDEDGNPIRHPEQMIPIAACTKPFYRGSLLLIKEHTFVPTRKCYKDELFILATTLGSSKLSWMSYAGYNAGERTILDFESDTPSAIAISSQSLLQYLKEFYTATPEFKYDSSRIFYIDGWLELA
jgi:hypothetical protein